MSGIFGLLSPAASAAGKAALPSVPGLPFSPGGIPNISGGDAKSGNGDSIFTNTSDFGGLDYSKGVPMWALMLAAGLGLWLYVRR